MSSQSKQVTGASLATSAPAMTVKQIREAAGFSQSEAAALADCAPNTWRVFEIDQSAPTPRMQAKCTAATEQMASKIKSVAA